MEERTYYTRGGGGGYGGGGMGLPKPQKGVATLLIINIATFVIQQIWPPLTDAFSAVAVEWWQIWRLVTFQFLHADPFHLLFNMIGLYFLGMYLERAWGTGRFLRFYLACGAVAGLSHFVLMYLNGSVQVGLIGASGGVYAVIAACAILFPQIRLIVLFFPMPIRTAAVLFLAISGLSLLSGGGGAISHAAHFGGMIAGGLWVLAGPKLADIKVDTQQRVQEGAWKKKMEAEAREQEEIDRILRKIQQEGLDSLTSREQRTLKDATDKQRQRDNRINKM
jgi:membrane associated rhomboid family serine protease